MHFAGPMQQCRRRFAMHQCCRRFAGPAQLLHQDHPRQDELHLDHRGFWHWHDKERTDQQPGHHRKVRDQGIHGSDGRGR